MDNSSFEFSITGDSYAEIEAQAEQRIVRFFGPRAVDREIHVGENYVGRYFARQSRRSAPAKKYVATVTATPQEP